MKRTFAAALACAVLLAGCSALAPSSGEPASTPASAPSSSPESAPSSAPAAQEVSLEDWRAAMPANAPSFTLAAAEPSLNEDVLWPEQVELIVQAWQGTLEEADAAFGLPAGSFSQLDDPDYPPPEGAMAIHAEGYVLPKTPVQQVTVEVPWASNYYENTSTGTLPAALDEQAACALAAARYFLYHHHGMHHGIEPSDYDNATDSYTVTDGAMYTRYSELEQFLGCVFTPEAYGEMLGGTLGAGEAPASGLFYQGEGDTIRYMMSDRGGSITFCGAVFTEPALQPDGSLLFWQLSLNLDDLDGNFQGWGEGVQHTPTLAFATPVRLVPSDNGWRVAEFTLPN